MILSQLVKELRVFSGLTEGEFCQRLSISTEMLNQWEADVSTQGPSVTKLFKALAVTISSRRNMNDYDRIEKRLNQAIAVVLTVSDSEETCEEHRVVLSVVTDLITEVKHDLLSN